MIPDKDIEEFVYLASERIHAEFKRMGLSDGERTTPRQQLLQDQTTRVDRGEVTSVFSQGSIREAFLLWLQKQPEPTEQQLGIMVANIQGTDSTLEHYPLGFAVSYSEGIGRPIPIFSTLQRFRIIERIDQLHRDVIERGGNASKQRIYRRIAPTYGVTPRIIKLLDLEEQREIED